LSDQAIWVLSQHMVATGAMF